MGSHSLAQRGVNKPADIGQLGYGSCSCIWRYSCPSSEYWLPASRLGERNDDRRTAVSCDSGGIGTYETTLSASLGILGMNGAKPIRCRCCLTDINLYLLIQLGWHRFYWLQFRGPSFASGLPSGAGKKERND